MARRLWEYNVLTTCTRGLTVRSFVLYLKKGGTIAQSPYPIISPDGPTVHLFYFTTIKLWELTSEEVQQLGLVGLLPLIPWTKDGGQREVIEEMLQRLATTNRELLSFGLATAADVLKSDIDRKWLTRSATMYEELLKENWWLREVTQKMAQEAAQKAAQEGWQEGRQEELQEERKRLRQVLMSFTSTRFPEVIALAEQQADLITDPEVLQNLIVRLFSVQAAEEARQILLAEGQDEQKN